MAFEINANSIPARAGPDTIFARIRPSNDEAINHFDDLVNSMQDGFLTHYENFVRIDDFQSLLGDAPGHSRRWEGWLPEENPELTRRVWTGEFILYIRPDPPLRRNKWRIGGASEIDGNVYARGKAQSDLLLWDKHDSTDEDHAAELFFDRTSGILTLRGRCMSNTRSVTLDSQDASSSTHLLNENSHTLQFGRCAYSFKYEFGESTDSETLFQRDKIEFFSDRLRLQPPIVWTSATPSLSFPKVKNWVIHGNVSTRGVSSIVRAASKSSPPQCAAVKTMVRVNAETVRFIAQEMQIGVHIRDLLKENPCPFILKFEEAIYDRDQEEWDGESAEQVHLVFTPLCNKNFDDLVKSPITIPIREKLSLLYDVVQGLEWLHSNDLVHRDIKLENLGVVYHPKCKAVILDFGVVHRGTKGIVFRKDAPAGTIDYIAPEMEVEPYDEKVDIWSLGIVAYRMFIDYDLPWMTATNYNANPWRMDIQPGEFIASPEAFQAWIDRRNEFDIAMEFVPHWGELEDTTENTTDIGDLIVKMLTWEPDKRPNARACSLHLCFDAIADD